MSQAETQALRRARFEAVFLVLREEVLEHCASEGLPDDAIQWYSRNLTYNVTGGKLNRGLAVVDTIEILKGRSLSDSEFFRASLLGWCVELLQAVFLVSDDMMDRCATRRGKPCYYRLDGVNHIAVNDSTMLEAAIFHLLRVHFRSEPYYVHLLELFHEVTHKTEMGQLLDLITAPEGRVDLHAFSLERHRNIVTKKTAYYSFYLPVAISMHMCGIPHLALPSSSCAPSGPYDIARDILLPLGEYFQVQDDFLDFVGTPEQLGKVGTDIVDGKCSWCVNTALAHVTPAQRALLDADYGRNDPAAEVRVKALYEDIGLRGLYEQYEKAAYKRIIALIETIPEHPASEDSGSVVLKREVFTSFLDKINKRQK